MPQIKAVIVPLNWKNPAEVNSLQLYATSCTSWASPLTRRSHMRPNRRLAASCISTGRPTSSSAPPAGGSLLGLETPWCGGCLSPVFATFDQSGGFWPQDTQVSGNSTRHAHISHTSCDPGQSSSCQRHVGTCAVAKTAVNLMLFFFYYHVFFIFL